MKTLIILSLILSFTITIGSANTKLTGPEKPLAAKTSWTKSEKGTWVGGFNTLYKIDKKKDAVKLSVNGKRWKTATDAVWQDNQGRWLCIYDGKLMCKDDGKKWVEAPDNKWQDLTGKWFRFDNTSKQLEEAAL